MKEEKKEQHCREEEPFLTSCSDSARALYKSMLEYKRNLFGIRFFAGDVYADLGTVRPDSQQFLLIRIDESGAEAFLKQLNIICRI